MKRILAFSFFPAFVPPSNGGQARLFHFYQALSEWFDITLLTSTHIGGEEEVVHHGAGFVERRIPKDRYFVEEWARLEPWSGGGDLSGPCIAACGRFPTLLHDAYLEEHARADIVIHEFPFTVDYDLLAGVDGKPRIYDAHNCETQLYAQLHGSDRSAPIRDLVRGAEIRMLEAADLVFYCGEADLRAFRELAPDARFDAAFVPHGMTPIKQPAATHRTRTGPPSAVFIGSGHPPNRDAAEFIARTLAPRLPDVGFDIVGTCLPEARYSTNVRRHGAVSDQVKEQLYDKADLALNPMLSGSGANVKVLDYLAHGLPVVSTAFGMRGIDAVAGEHYLAASLDEFPRVIAELVGDGARLDALGANGRALASERHTWRAIAGAAAGRLEALVEARGTRPQERFVLALNDYDSFAAVGGGGTRTRGLYEAVAEWAPVVFVSFSSDGALQARKIGERITAITVPKTQEHLAELLAVNGQHWVSSDDIVAARHASTNRHLVAIYRVLRERARCVVVEHCYMVALPRAFGDRFVYSSHNHEAALKRRLLEAHPLRDELVRDVELLERVAVEGSAATIAVSREDASAMVCGKRMAGPVVVVRNGAAPPSQDVAQGVEQRIRRKIRAGDVVFLGSAHMPNIEAANVIAKEIAPRCTHVGFHLIGSVCDGVGAVPRNVTSWGVLDDATKSAVMQACALAVNPVASGSGSNVKLADYLGHGLFVVTTEFGQRGYPAAVREHVRVVPIEGFAGAITETLDKTELFTEAARAARRQLFERELTMHALARRFVDVLRGLETRRRRVLYVAYRYTEPPMGGAEVNIERFVRALGESGEFDVDVVAPEVSGIQSYWRFSEIYSFAPGTNAPVDIPNARFARFPAGVPDPRALFENLRRGWRAQGPFERQVSQRVADAWRSTGLTWGWGYPEGGGNSTVRWAYVDCGVHLAGAGTVRVEGVAPAHVVIAAEQANTRCGGPWTVEGAFDLQFGAGQGEVRFRTSAPLAPGDPRPLGFLVRRLSVDGVTVDLRAPLLARQAMSAMPAEVVFGILDEAAGATRGARDIRLTEMRGPWSSAMERFIADRVGDYDLVVTHNNIFRPAVVAIEEARRRGVPSLLVPHVHLDDDFYHFPDVLESARTASQVLAVPKAACRFLKSRGCNVRYLPAGCDTQEAFAPEDVAAFDAVRRSRRRFVLVLGRKAGAKGYRTIIDAVDGLNAAGLDLQAVLIGPDDDGAPVTSSNAVYLGRQPRSVVRGALMSCVALVNMSVSESFGIVLLEAWLAGRPVVVNKACAAFHDMAVDGENALMVNESGLPAAIRRLAEDENLARALAQRGRGVTTRFDWAAVSAEFVSICLEAARGRRVAAA